MDVKLEHLVMFVGIIGSAFVSYFTFEATVEKQIAVTNEMIKENTERINQLNDMMESKIAAGQSLTQEQIQNLSNKISDLQTTVNTLSGNVSTSKMIVHSNDPDSRSYR